jgi:hypothetical protein
MLIYVCPSKVLKAIELSIRSVLCDVEMESSEVKIYTKNFWDLFTLSSKNLILEKALYHLPS